MRPTKTLVAALILLLLGSVCEAGPPTSSVQEPVEKLTFLVGKWVRDTEQEGTDAEVRTVKVDPSGAFLTVVSKSSNAKSKTVRISFDSDSGMYLLKSTADGEQPTFHAKLVGRRRLEIPMPAPLPNAIFNVTVAGDKWTETITVKDSPPIYMQTFAREKVKQH